MAEEPLLDENEWSEELHSRRWTFVKLVIELSGDEANRNIWLVVLIITLLLTVVCPLIIIFLRDLLIEFAPLVK